MGGCDVEGDDVDALADAEDVAAVHGVPERSAVAEVGLGGEEELEGDVRGSGRVCEDLIGLVVGGDVAAEGAGGIP